jgi:hypothetical protein
MKKGKLKEKMRCSCGDEWYGYGDDCEGCAYNSGKYDAEMKEEYNPPYKNFNQVDAYKAGYEEGQKNED